MNKNCLISSIAFLKIRLPPEEIDKGGQAFDLLDQTRIHFESYSMALKVATDVIYQNADDLTEAQKYNAVKEIILNPKKLEALDEK